ncbi:MAG: DUF6382 domain-containing protein [Lachnospiraceae bacterium]
MGRKGDINYIESANHSYFILEKQQMDYQMQMILVNPLENLLKVEAHQLNTSTDFYYEVSSLISLKGKYQSAKIEGKQIQIFFYELQHVISVLESYLLDENRLVLDPEYIYWNEATQNALFCFAPEGYQNICFQEGLQNLIQYIMKRVNHEDEISMKMAYRIFNVVIRDHFRLEDVLLALREVSKEEGMKENIPQESMVLEEIKEPSFFNAKKLKSYSNEQCDSKLEKNQGKSILWIKVLAAASVISICSILFLWGEGLLNPTLWSLLGARRMLKILLGRFLGVFSLAVGILLGIIYLRHKKLDKQAAENEKQETSFGRQRIRGGAENEIQEQNSVGQRVRVEKSERVEPEEFQENLIGEIEEEQDFIEVYPDETSALMETTVLEVQSQKSHQLLSREASQYDSFTINTYPFLIGKDSSQCQAVLPLSTVSRVHARLEREGELVYLYDNGSTNGTWVNQRKIEKEEKILLKTGDEVKFAVAIFTFL